MKTLFSSIFCMLLCSFSSFAQNWPQLGSNIEGESAGDQSGWVVALSSDGSTLAIGAPFNDGGGINSGHVRIYKNVSGLWTQIGADLNGDAKDDHFGYSVDISNDGNTVAIGARYNSRLSHHRGHVKIFELVKGSWKQVGADIQGEESGDQSGHSVSISGDGTTVAIGAPYNEANTHTQRNHDPGHVRIYKNLSGTWTQVGKDIDGENVYDGSGWSVSLSNDGTTVAIGTPYNDGGGNSAGHVRVYKNVNGTWTKVGSDIDGDNIEDELGFSVSLSADGNIVAIGAIMSQGNHVWDKGYVRVLKNVSGTWKQVGSDIIGEAMRDQFGYSVSLSADGNTLLVGTPNNDGKGQRAGHARIYNNVKGTWTQLGSDIDGDTANLKFGYSVSLSGDGTTAAIGIPYSTIKGTKSLAGEVSIFTDCLATEGIDTVAACKSYTWIDGITYDKSNSTAIDTLVNNAGCDSVVRLNLTIMEPSTSSLKLIECDRFVSSTGKIWTRSGSYKDTLKNSNGCDSVISYDLSIIISKDIISQQPNNQLVVPSNEAAFSIGLTSDSTHSFQWQENKGNGFQNLANIGPFTGTQSKVMKISNVTASYDNYQYRCIASLNNCTDTSDLATLTIDKASITETSFGETYVIYPNPNQGVLFIRNAPELKGKNFKIYSSNGSQVFSGNIKGNVTKINIHHLPGGLYNLRIGDDLKINITVIKE